MRFKDTKPFYKVNVETGEEKGRVITLRLNEDEDRLVKRLKILFDIEADTKAIKIAMKTGINVLLSVFGEETLKYLFSRKRERKSDYEKPQKPENSVFVIPKKEDL
jgi:hypothetical protein